MTTKSEILIVSTVADVATDSVVRCLALKGVAYRRVNTEDYPFRNGLTLDYQCSPQEQLSFDGEGVRSHSIWYRRVRSPSQPDNMDPGVYDFCLRENRAALLGGLLAQNARWMSNPACVWSAEFKPYQLKVAQDVGLSIPRTIISNEPEAIRRAYREFGSLIVKPVRSGHFRQGGKEFAIFTSLMCDEHMEHLGDTKWVPSIYQQLIPKRYDVRVTFVGTSAFSAAIHSQTDIAAVVDWRKTNNPALPHSIIELPANLIERLRSLMQKMGLEFGCVDLVMTPDGDYVFLEVNPSGQWLWLDDQLELGISHAVADWLVGDTCD